MIAGADGCKAGWVVALAEDWPARSVPRLELCAGMAEVLRLTEGCRALVVDIPLGLPADGQRRECDALAKKLLGRNHPRVFYTPPRSLLAALDYPEFNREHRRQFAGKGISKQAFCLLPKLRDTDRAIGTGCQRIVREFHPELVWQRLAGAPVASKHKPEGLATRWRLLEGLVPDHPGLRAWRATKGSALKDDDLLDALVGLDLAHRLATNPERASCLPANPPRDERGLRMEIWF